MHNVHSWQGSFSVGSAYLSFDASWMLEGEAVFLAIKMIKDGNIVASTLIPMSEGMSSFVTPAWNRSFSGDGGSWEQKQLAQQQAAMFMSLQNSNDAARRASEALADMLTRSIDWKKGEDGIWLPKVEQGDTVIVDKKESKEVKVLDVAEQAYEKIPKKKMEIVQQDCTCPIRDLMIWGCRCAYAQTKKSVT